MMNHDYARSEIENLQFEVEQLLTLVDNLRLEIVEERKKVEKAETAATYLRIVLTNMTQEEQMEAIYSKWPWLRTEEE